MRMLMQIGDADKKAKHKKGKGFGGFKFGGFGSSHGKPPSADLKGDAKFYTDVDGNADPKINTSLDTEGALKGGINIPEVQTGYKY